MRTYARLLLVTTLLLGALPSRAGAQPPQQPAPKGGNATNQAGAQTLSQRRAPTAISLFSQWPTRPATSATPC